MKPTQGEYEVDTSIDYEVIIVCPWSEQNKPENSATYGDYRGSMIATAHYNSGVPTKAQAVANLQHLADLNNAWNELPKTHKIYEPKKLFAAFLKAEKEAMGLTDFCVFKQMADILSDEIECMEDNLHELSAGAHLRLMRYKEVFANAKKFLE